MKEFLKGLLTSVEMRITIFALLILNGFFGSVYFWWTLTK